ncbi:MAG: hypothetical protein FD127_4140, partial [Acidimicrobiaceae bacterium]
SERSLQVETDRTVLAFDRAGEQLGALAWMIVAAGLAAAVLAFLGYGRRLREYR